MISLNIHAVNVKSFGKTPSNIIITMMMLENVKMK
jgi:hypothetical protein